MAETSDLFQQAMNQGHSAAWDQLWDQAAQYYRQALQLSPNHPKALTSLGLALLEIKEYEGALRCYLQAAKVSPNDPFTVEKIAHLYERLGNIDRAQAAAMKAAELYLKNREANRAVENWTRAIRLNPQNLQARMRLAFLYERLGRKKEAVAEYLNIASLLQHSSELEKAARSIQHALQILPASEEAYQALEMLKASRPLPKPARPPGGTAPLRMAQVRRLEASQAEASSAAKIDPIGEARRKALSTLAGLLFDGGEEEQPGAAPRRGLQAIVRSAGNLLPKHFDRNRIHLHLSQVVDLQTRGENEKAAEELGRAIEAGLNHPAAYFDLGLLQFESGLLEEALRSLQPALKSTEFNLGARLLLGQVLQKTGRYREAAVEYLYALQLADSGSVADEHAGDMSQLYEPIIEIQSQKTEIGAQQRLCENIAGLLLQPDWRERLRSARQRMPVENREGPPVPLAEMMIQSRSSQVLDSLAKINRLADSGYLHSAMEEAFYALQYAPTYLPLHAYMGELLLKQDRLSEAVAKLLVVAHTYTIRGESSRAIDLYRRVIELAPMDLNARSYLIDQLVALGRTEQALAEHLEFAEVYYDLADREMAHKVLAEALRLAQQSRADQGWQVKILHRIADIDLQSMDWRQALRIFEQIRTLQPGDENARVKLVELNFRLGQESTALSELDNYLTYLAGSGQKGKAVEFMEMLLQENLDRPSIRRRLAELYGLQGDVARAVAHLDTAGEMYLQAGDRANAVRSVEAILALKPPNLFDYQRLLDQLKMN